MRSSTSFSSCSVKLLLEQQPSSSEQPNDKTNAQQQPPTPPSPHFEQLMQENMTLKYEVNSLRKSLVETQQYSKTTYETFQAIREKFEAEQRLTSKLKMDHTAMVESYELQLKKLRETPPSSSVPPLLAPAPLPPPALSVPVEVKHKESVKDEPIDYEVHRNNLGNQLLETQIAKDRLEQTPIDLDALHFVVKTCPLPPDFDNFSNEMDHDATQLSSKRYRSPSLNSDVDVTFCDAMREIYYLLTTNSCGGSFQSNSCVNKDQVNEECLPYKRLRLSQMTPVLQPVARDLVNISEQLNQTHKKSDPLPKYKNVDHFLAENTELDLWFGEIQDQELVQFLSDNPHLDI